MTGAEFLFWLFAGLTCGGAIAVVVSQNVVRMAFWLVISLGSVAGLFFLLGADFVGATQLLIYVGGTVVLLIFGVMLTASGPYLQIRTSPADAFLAAGVGVLFLGMIVSAISAVDWRGASLKVAEIPAVEWARIQGDTRVSHEDAEALHEWYLLDESGEAPVYRLNHERGLSEEDSAKLAQAWEGIREARSDEAASTVRPLGLAFLGLRPDRDLGRPEEAGLSTGYLLPFEIISIHLLVVLIGAAYLARAKRRMRPREGV